ncbi:MAG TPA: helix-turn-helix transcriptional regulator [Solirubrobacterales bacterium]|jgi:transcriptional regulator with XRE-family HTH domain|nr:helix-turn-helix transcriptional regulator [Solirubrobacterales bacterium]
MAPSDQPQPALGKAIRELREKKGTTQEAVAHDAGITTATLGVIERGLSNPTWATLRGIAVALGTSMVEVARLAERHE